MAESILLESLNDEQKIGVTTTEGPVLILAGAGSGKTRVLTNRVAYLIQEKGVEPYHIMAITFTNKAAREMRERINAMIHEDAESIWVSTFHSSCVRILRRFIDRLGYDNHFTIYDADDQKTLMKDVCKKLEIDKKKFKEKTFLNHISSAKNELVGPEEFLNRAMGDFNRTRVGQVYREYQNRLRQSNALDFDDLIMKTVELFKLDPEVLNFYQEKFQYVMVDEYQDTNTAQFELVRLLAGGRNNLCVVGDDDQSIYKFRGANIYNILNFEQNYRDATVIKLEQNYRSTQTILDAANAVIANNGKRKDKALWTQNDKGEKICFEQFDTAYEEAGYIASNIVRAKREGEFAYGDNAILYRTNAQSRILEEKLIQMGVPYKIVGGVNFYSRKEIKDILAYLKTIDNAVDEIAVRRIINVPKRGIGATTLNRVSDYAVMNQITYYDALCGAASIPSIGKAASKIEGFVLFIQAMQVFAKEHSVAELIKEVLDQTGYLEDLKVENTEEAKARIENIDELVNKAVTYTMDAEEPSLSGFLEEVALVADIDNLEEDTDYVVLMTLHSAKGLEFPNVYMAGMEDGLFPSYMSLSDESEELEEERRLCYVGITRAEKKLTMTSAKMRMIRGETQFGAISRFVKEIPSELIRGNLWEPKRKDDLPFLEGNPFDGNGNGNGNGNGAFGRSDIQKGFGAFGRSDIQKGFGGSGMQTMGARTGRNPWKNQATQAAEYKARTSSKKFGTKIEKGTLSYGVGDRVKHVKFGEGIVQNIHDGGRDYEVTVDFERVGVKKMFASFAKLKKC